MTRGRKPDGPALQALKGSPGKRARTRNMESRATRLAANDPLTPPDFLKVKRGEPGQDLALRIWRELAPHLQRRNLLDRMDRYAFARWCVYQAEWIEATQTIRTEGISRMVKTVSGDEMLRRNPAALHRDKVELAMVKLEASYGLTPADRYKVMRDQAAAPLGGLFGKGDENPDQPAAANAPSVADPVGFLSARAAPPPGSRPN
ncbi:phage terminase, small subunit [Methylobacterium sp. ME121]|nr:phage terminase, small subunit [Methylobacterium sp. ME121]